MSDFLKVYRRSETDKLVKMFKPGCEPQSFAAAALANNTVPQILDLPQMQFTEDESTNTQAAAVTSNGIPLLDLPKMNFEKPTNKAATDDYMAQLPSMAFHEKK